jgi:hypothetical protein
MKKLILYVLLIISCTAQAQFTKPTGAVSIPTYSFYRTPADSTFAIYQGTALGYGIFYPSSYINTRLLKLNQTAPQTITNGIPLMTSTVNGSGSVSQLVNKGYVDLAVASTHLTEYFSAVALSPAVGTFLQMDNPVPSSGTVQSVDITGSIGSPTAIFKWLTPVAHPHLDRIPAGSFDIHAHLLKTTTAPNNKIVAVYAEVWQNNAAGAHTAKIATSATYQGFTTSDAFYDIYATVATEFPLALTDRISIEWFGYVISGGGQNKLTMTVGGTADSHMEIDVSSSELQAIFVPYTGAEHDVNLGDNSITADSIIRKNGLATQFLMADGSTTTGGMTYPAAPGIAVSTGTPPTAWGTSITDASSNWNDAYTDRLKWNGGGTGLNASSGRSSLGLNGWSTINNDVQTLTVSAGAAAWDTNAGINAKVTLTGNVTITLSNLATNGMSGTLTVINDATARTITFAGYTNKINPAVRIGANQVITSGGSFYDLFSWYWNGTHLFWNGSYNYN